MNPIATLRALLAKATFTMPMQVLSDNGKPVDMTPGEDGYVYIPELASLGDTGIAFVNDYEDRQHDAALIVAAINALPGLLDVAEAAQKQVDTCSFCGGTGEFEIGVLAKIKSSCLQCKGLRAALTKLKTP